MCSIKRWSPQNTYALGTTCLRSTCLQVPQPKECMCRYRRHQYTAERTFTGDRCGLWDRGYACASKLPCLACLSISEYCRRCGWSAGLQRRVPRNNRSCVIYRREACDVHLCTISFDLWAPRHCFKIVIYCRQKSADSDELWKSSRIRMRTRNL